MVIEPMNGVWCAYMVFIAAACVLMYFLLRRRSGKARRNTLLIIAIINQGLYVFYYVLMYMQGKGELLYTWGTLPLHLCNLVTIFLVIAFALRNDSLLGLCFYFGAVSAMAALIAPENIVKDAAPGIFDPLSIGYYGVHGLNIVLSICIVTLGFFTPAYKKGLRAFLQLGLITAIIFAIDLLMRNTVYAQANYFYLFSDGGSPALELLQRPLPHPLIRMLPVYLIAGAITVILTFIYKLATGALFHKKKAVRETIVTAGIENAVPNAGRGER